MDHRLPFVLTAIALAYLIGMGNAYALVVQIDSQSAFSADGTIFQNTNWDSYGAGFFYPPSSFTVGDLTFVAGGQNIIGGVGTPYNLSRNLFTDNFGLGMTILIAGTYDMFAVNAGHFAFPGSAVFTITTNLGTYTFNETVSVAYNQGPLTFLGFEADAGEFFTSVNWTWGFSGVNAVGVTDVQLGSIPEPATLALLGLGLAGLGFNKRRSKNS